MNVGIPTYAERIHTVKLATNKEACGGLKICNKLERCNKRETKGRFAIPGIAPYQVNTGAITRVEPIPIDDLAVPMG